MFDQSGYALVSPINHREKKEGKLMEELRVYSPYQNLNFEDIKAPFLVTENWDSYNNSHNPRGYTYNDTSL